MGMQKYTGEWPDWIALTGEIIAQNAKECAWPYGTAKSKYTYAKGDIKKNPNPKQYGNYMQLPPEDKRLSHQIDAYWI